MKITSVRIKKNNTASPFVLGIASVQLDNCLVIHNIKLIQREDKRMISFPSIKVKKYKVNSEGYEQNYEYTDVVHPSNSEFRKYIEDELFKIYDLEEKKGEQRDE